MSEILRSNLNMRKNTSAKPKISQKERPSETVKESEVQSVFVNVDAGVFRKLVTTIVKNNYIKCNNAIPIINYILIGNQEYPHNRPPTIARGLSGISPQQALHYSEGTFLAKIATHRLERDHTRRRSALLIGCQHTKRSR